ncbi:hypothetical protein CC99x_009775 [Candidatus Berkiella cookevillensis]|uniref:Uncharacterized protein n=1 Tax=Candidatus Berkiella cookevillensis TaxID=437022 RepID=A0A0Q9YMH6_9GAMM|nr:hypothetical protein [Candidatus Berkiella cookevillensis]MCS5709193.1 hypothetical protein [Candidatus Berkiella cookevillensis]
MIGNTEAQIVEPSISMIDRFYCTSANTLTQYFDTRKRIHKGRFSDFVLLPLPLMLLEQEISELDSEVTDIYQFSKSTIGMLKNTKSKKVYPFPIIPIKNSLKEVQPIETCTLAACATAILNEKQFIPTFNIVGHGTPSGVGFSDVDTQLNPAAYAGQIQELFEWHKLSALKHRPLNFVFHTCNSAYAKVSSTMERADILRAVSDNSFIGIFYKAMQEFGYENLTVTGYRGYYCSLTARGASRPIVQDSFHTPSTTLNALKGQYVISKAGCKTSASTIDQMCFPVLPYDNITTSTEMSSNDWLDAPDHREGTSSSSLHSGSSDGQVALLASIRRMKI